MLLYIAKINKIRHFCALQKCRTSVHKHQHHMDLTSRDKPCFNTGDCVPRHCILLHINGPIAVVIPQRGLVIAVDNVEFNLDVSVQWRIAKIRCSHTYRKLFSLRKWVIVISLVDNDFNKAYKNSINKNTILFVEMKDTGCLSLYIYAKKMWYVRKT